MTTEKISLKDLGILRINIDSSKELIKNYFDSKIKFFAVPVYYTWVESFVDEDSGEVIDIERTDILIHQFQQCNKDLFHDLYDHEKSLNSRFIYLFEEKFNPNNIPNKIIGEILKETCLGDFESKEFIFEELFEKILKKEDNYFTRRSIDVAIVNKVKPWINKFFNGKLHYHRIHGKGFKLSSNIPDKNNDKNNSDAELQTTGDN